MLYTYIKKAREVNKIKGVIEMKLQTEIDAIKYQLKEWEMVENKSVLLKEKIVYFKNKLNE
jgi:hypothetical protein